MADEFVGRLHQLSNAFCRIADRVPWVRARFTVNEGRFGLFMLGPPIQDGSDEGLVHGSLCIDDFAIISELYALTDQAGVLFSEIFQSGQYPGKFSSPVTIQYDLKLPRDPWLFVLLHTAPVCFHCKTSDKNKGLNLALTKLGKGEVVVWIDIYPQVCVSALAWLKTNLLSGRGTSPGTSAPEESPDISDQATPEENGKTKWMKKGPLGLTLNTNTHSVEKNGVSVSFESNARPWEVFIKLIRRHPGRYPVKDLGHDVWNLEGKDIDPDDNLVQQAITTIRSIIARLGVGVDHGRNLGYVLSERAVRIRKRKKPKQKPS
jgi:hypothetical protein